MKEETKTNQNEETKDDVINVVEVEEITETEYDNIEDFESIRKKDKLIKIVKKVGVGVGVVTVGLVGFFLGKSKGCEEAYNHFNADELEDSNETNIE